MQCPSDTGINVRRNKIIVIKPLSLVSVNQLTLKVLNTTAADYICCDFLSFREKRALHFM